MSQYDPNGLLVELDSYQVSAEAYFDDNMSFTEDVRIYGENITVDHSHRGPERIKLEMLDDIVPLSIEVYGHTYRLEHADDQTATYKHWS